MKTITSAALAILLSLLATTAYATSITFGAKTTSGGVTGSPTVDGDVATATMNYRSSPATVAFQFNSLTPFTVTHTGFLLPPGNNGLILFAGHGAPGAGLIGATNCTGVGAGVGDISCQLINSGTVGTSYGGTFAAGNYTLVLHEGNGEPSQNSVEVTLTAVPLPAAAWLFLSALGGLGVIARRKRTA